MIASVILFTLKFVERKLSISKLNAVICIHDKSTINGKSLYGWLGFVLLYTNILKENYLFLMKMVKTKPL